MCSGNSRNATCLLTAIVSDAGIVLVVAAGNEYQDIDSPNGFENRDGDWIDLRGQRPYPACFQFDNMITVAAIASDDVKADFSNYSPNFVHLAAPGVKIWSTVPGNSYDVYGGTSMATPHVAGAAALLAAHAPGLSAGEIKSRILANVTANSKVSGKVSTGGNLNLLDILKGSKAVVPVTSVVIPSAQKSLSLKEGGSVTLSVTVGPSNATNSMVAWSSSDPNVATVSGKGVVTAVKAGTATIYAKSNDGSSVSDSATVTVTSSFIDEGIGGGCNSGYGYAAAFLILPLLLFAKGSDKRE